MFLHGENRRKTFAEFSYYIFSEHSFYALVTYWPYRCFGKVPASDVFKIGFINMKPFGRCLSSSFFSTFVFLIFICCV